jgi:glycosyltransferase involved in cell wall biosynthesis
MNNTPLVSIGVPVYNGEESLARTLDCLLGQTYQNIELILSDNASTDATAQICQKYCAQDTRIRYVRQEKNLGLHGNWTYVADQAQGEFFMWAAADDYWEPEFIEVLVKKLQAEPDAISAFCPYRLFNKERQEYEGEAVLEDYGHRNAFVRVYKLTRLFLDRSNHALIRRQRAKDIEYKLWLFPKITTVYNIAFPSLYFLVAKGNFVLTSLDKPLWRKTMTSKPAHDLPHARNPALTYLGHVIRKIHLFFRSLAYIRRGADSYLFMLACIPLLFARMAFDIVMPVWVVLKVLLSGKSIKGLSPHEFWKMGVR